MSDARYVTDYFSTHAAQWVAGAYGSDPCPPQYPVGAHRVRLALTTLAKRFSIPDDLLDLGCGGGELCLAAAEAGWQAAGIDIAAGMIDEAKKKRAQLAEPLGSRVEFFHRDALKNECRANSYGAVAALGLIEYMPEDAPLCREAYRVLKPGGVWIVSCRNRLFNLSSLNRYTEDELATGQAKVLLAELQSLVGERAIENTAWQAFLGRLSEMSPVFSQALKADEEEARLARSSARPPAFQQDRRQHTPQALWESARAAGFAEPMFLGVHPHPLPPAVEQSAPRLYHALARAFEVFEELPVSLVWSSAFLGVFVKPGAQGAR